MMRKRLFMAAATVLALGGFGVLIAPTAAMACNAPVVSGTTATVTCEYTGAEETFEVPQGVSKVKIEADGAQGGTAEGVEGGKGASLKAGFHVSAGQLLGVLVGGMGASDAPYAGGGGGGSFVAGNSFSSTSASRC